MPTHASDTPVSPLAPDISQANVACPAPLTAPSESNTGHELGRTFAQHRSIGEDEVIRGPMNDNTATSMSLMQEESIYSPSEAFEDKMHTDSLDSLAADDSNGDSVLDDANLKMNGDTRTADYDMTSVMDLSHNESRQHTSLARIGDSDAVTVGNESCSTLLSPPPEPSREERTRGFCGTTAQAGIPPIDQELDWSSDLREWDSSRRRLRPQYPSATFQPYSKFKGTQQSDRQIYNVEVTMLTVDIEQSTMSGYLQICGLTPDHPTLTTFFTGEIIGGPDQKYGFKTQDPAWGATDKTDLTHWARFPAWRPLSLQAKRNINFVYPLNHEDWWQQEYVFMRWKEHFLVPDYKLKSIQGASFEGFYYICLNQVEGRVSGIYFHSKSEKYQQLELKHEGKQGVWRKGVCPSVEFR